MDPITVNDFSALDRVDIVKKFFTEKDSAAWENLGLFLQTRGYREMSHGALVAEKGEHAAPIALAKHLMEKLASQLVPVEVLADGLDRFDMENTLEFVTDLKAKLVPEMISAMPVPTGFAPSPKVPEMISAMTVQPKPAATPYPHAPTVRVEAPKRHLPENYHETFRAPTSVVDPDIESIYTEFKKIVEIHGCDKVREWIAVLATQHGGPATHIVDTINPRAPLIKDIPKEVRNKMAQHLASHSSGRHIGLMFESSYKFTVSEDDARSNLGHVPPVKIMEFIVETIANHRVTKADFVKAVGSGLIGYPMLIKEPQIRDYFVGY